MRSILINGEVAYNAPSQIFNSVTFREILAELINDSEEKKNSLLSLFEPFLRNTDTMETSRKYDIDGIVELLLALTIDPIEKIDGSSYYSFPKMSNKRELLVRFVESLFSLWRNKHRFIVKRDEYTPNRFDRIFKQMVLVRTNTDLKSLVLSLYRQILINVSDIRLKILRQEPGGAQVGFIVDNPEVDKRARVPGADWLYGMACVWSIVFEPPVIFYTRSNKRHGLFEVRDKPILSRLNIPSSNDWFLFPIHVGSKLIDVVVNKEYLSLAAGLGNLFELASFDIVKNKKPDGIYILGIDNSFFEKKEDFNGVIYREDDGTYIGIVGDDPSIDYFGYMKKMILTIHNLLVIDEGRLPVHGALAHIKLRNGKKANVMLIGDSGAGKSETLDALNRLHAEVSEVNILIDDMGSLDITSSGSVIAYGTETGAFVRLDDLQPGYAYSTMDRSIFMNPNEINARVIVPYSNYTDIIKPTKVDYFLYANNYNEDKDSDLRIFKDAEEAAAVFSNGARMAKGTTTEKGLTYSYFANPFGAIQRRERHEVIADRYLKAMIDSGVRVGEVRTRLGIPGYEMEGPLMAAKALLKAIDEQS